MLLSFFAYRPSACCGGAASTGTCEPHALEEMTRDWPPATALHHLLFLLLPIAAHACRACCRKPDHLQRQAIWRKQLGGKIQTADDLDVSALALKYELSGGFIRNAVQAALSR